MRQIAVRVEKTGRILIPVDIRRQLKLVEGESEVLLNVDDIGVST
jgi:bifunctional DNA-binding transcriptional regulator/antitoxin component of YhaV-PrlF toxin-antitoxin module